MRACRFKPGAHRLCVWRCDVSPGFGCLADSLARRVLARHALQPSWSPVPVDAGHHKVSDPGFDRCVDDEQVSPAQAQALCFVASQAHVPDVVRAWLQHLVEVFRRTVILYSRNKKL